MKKIVCVIGFLGLTLILVLTNWLYHSVQSKHNKEQQQAINEALAKTELVTVEQVDPFIGEDALMIVYGKDQEGKQLIVWVGKNEIHAEYSLDGISKQQVEVKVLKQKPKADLIRIIPGKLKDDYIWEAYYKEEEKDGTRYYYSYYKFADGQPIDTYKLSRMN